MGDSNKSQNPGMGERQVMPALRLVDSSGQEPHPALVMRAVPGGDPNPKLMNPPPAPEELIHAGPHTPERPAAVFPAVSKAAIALSQNPQGMLVFVLDQEGRVKAVMSLQEMHEIQIKESRRDMPFLAVTIAADQENTPLPLSAVFHPASIAAPTVFIDPKPEGEWHISRRLRGEMVGSPLFAPYR